MKAPQKSFAAGFNGEEDSIKGQEMPENEGGVEEPGETGAPAVVVAIGAPADENGEGPATTGVADDSASESGAYPEEMQMNHSEKSWNGRLTAREKELKARADELDARSAEIEGQRLPTYDEAVAALTGDFGEDFVKLIQVVAQGATKGEVETSTAELRTKIDGITEGVKGAFGELHKEMISSQHEDFEDIAASEEFKAYIDSMPDEQKAAAMQVIESGTARQIVKLLNDFKKTLTTTEGNDNSRYDSAALDAAAGVRSSGGRAPSLGGDRAAAGGEVDRFRAGFNA